MSSSPYRWTMVTPGEPMVRTAFEIGEIGAGEVVVEVAGDWTEVATMSVIGQRKRIEAGRQLRAFHDELTGLPGRRKLALLACLPRWSCHEYFRPAT